MAGSNSTNKLVKAGDGTLHRADCDLLNTDKPCNCRKSTLLPVKRVSKKKPSRGKPAIFKKLLKKVDKKAKLPKLKPKPTKIVPEKKPPHRPAVSEEEKDKIVQKLSRWLQMGFSLKKACLFAEIPKSTVYELLMKDRSFSDRIDLEKNYLPKTIYSVIFNELMSVAKKSGEGKKLNIQEQEFMKWYLTNSALTKFEFGQRPLDETDSFEDMVAKAEEELGKETPSERIKRIIADRTGRGAVLPSRSSGHRKTS